MKLTVENADRVDLPPDELAAALRDPGVLSRALPGDGEVERTGPRVATVLATAGIAGTRGTYRARVHVVEADDRRVVLRVAAAGEPGTIEAELTVELHADAGGTRVEHQLAATLDGRLAGLGRKVLEGAVAAGASRFLADLQVAVQSVDGEEPGAASRSGGAGSTAGAGQTSAGSAGSGGSSGSGVASHAGGTLAADPGQAGSPASGTSSVRTALTAAAVGALVTAIVVRWWHARQGG
jgi:uncharacterized protein